MSLFSRRESRDSRASQKPIRLESDGLTDPLVLLPDPERVIMFGMTGCGKSTLSRYLIQPRPKVIILDAKGDFAPPMLRAGAWKVTSNPRETIRLMRRDDHILYRPGMEHLDQFSWDEILTHIFHSGQEWTVDIDELTLVAPSSHPSRCPVGLRALCQQGRSKGLTTIMLSQEPRHVPSFTKSQCERAYAWRLISRQDRARAAEFIGPQAMYNPAGKHAFWYRHQDDDADYARQCVLQL